MFSRRKKNGSLFGIFVIAALSAYVMVSVATNSKSFFVKDTQTDSLVVDYHMVHTSFNGTLDDRPLHYFSTRALKAIDEGDKSSEPDLGPSIGWPPGDEDITDLPKSCKWQPSRLAECTMFECFNYSRCENKELKYFVYPSSGPLAVPAHYMYWDHFIRYKKWYTDDPEKACIFIPRIHLRDNGKNKGWQLMKKQKYWDEGRNHIMWFNWEFQPFHNFFHYAFRDDSLNTIWVTPNWELRSYRSGFDITYPPLHRYDSARLKEPLTPMSQRSILAFFKGKRYPGTKRGSHYYVETRTLLRAINNDKDIIVRTLCRGPIPDKDCAFDNAHYGDYPYKPTMLNTKFSLCPAGTGRHTTRFMEALAYGTVPVVIADMGGNWALPFFEIIDWSKCVIDVPVKKIHKIPDLLRSIPPETVERAGAECRRIFETYMATTEKKIDTFMSIIQRRIYTYSVDYL